jgi:predicted Zn-dependent protease with MMP-like domain
MNDLNEDAFRRIVEEEWANVPEKFQNRIENLALLIEDEPDADTRKEEKLEEGETLLGLYKGIAASERGENYGVGPTLPDTITLYRLPLMEESKTLLEKRSQSASHAAGDAFREAVHLAIRDTIWHEVGHYFGLDELGVEKRENEGTNRFS